MKLFLVEQTKMAYWGAYQSFVIRAEDEQAARQIAYEKVVETNINEAYQLPWLTEEGATVQQITEEGEAEIICSDFVEE